MQRDDDKRRYSGHLTNKQNISAMRVFLKQMISFSFLLIPFILLGITITLVVLISCLWMTLFYMQPNRTPVTYKSFYRHKHTKYLNPEKFLDDKSMLERPTNRY